jgi:hypothetical protein
MANTAQAEPIDEVSQVENGLRESIQRYLLLKVKSVQAFQLVEPSAINKVISNFYAEVNEIASSSSAVLFDYIRGRETSDHYPFKALSLADLQEFEAAKNRQFKIANSRVGAAVPHDEPLVFEPTERRDPNTEARRTQEILTDKFQKYLEKAIATPVLENLRGKYEIISESQIRKDASAEEKATLAEMLEASGGRPIPRSVVNRLRKITRAGKPEEGTKLVFTPMKDGSTQVVRNKAKSAKKAAKKGSAKAKKTKRS